MLIDSKGRRHLAALAPGAVFHSHAGTVALEALIGAEDGREVRTSLGARLVALRPTLAERVLEMPRGAQVIYPKDLGALLLLADIYPGALVVEAGTGSGALSMTLLRAGAEVIGYEVRPDFAERAKRNVEAALGAGALDHYCVRDLDVYEGMRESSVDRVMLDLPEPWRVVGHAAAAMRPGGILTSYLPSAIQVAELHRELDRSPFGLAVTVEIMERFWHVKGAAVRPEHRMVGHTGFLTAARLLA